MRKRNNKKRVLAGFFKKLMEQDRCEAGVSRKKTARNSKAVIPGLWKASRPSRDHQRNRWAIL